MSGVKYVTRMPAGNGMEPPSGNETHQTMPVVPPRENIAVVPSRENIPVVQTEGQTPVLEPGGYMPMDNDPPPPYTPS